jgi:ADP-heptose:LPS heptosyltransferase
MAFDDPSLGWLFRRATVDEELIAWMSAPDLPALKHARLVAPSRPSDELTHCASYLLETLAPLGIDRRVDERPLGVRPRPTDDILVHPGSGSVAKNWPAARFAATIAALRRPVRLIVGEADERAASAVEAHLGQPLPRLHSPPLDELAARLAGCAAYLGNDSGVSHLAGLCGARTVVLFGPTSPTVWRPLGPRVHVLSFDTPPARVIAALDA